MTGPTVMVVDDDADVRDTIQMALELHGARVVTATDGADALARLRAGERPSLILLDLMMPKVNGIEFRNAQLADPALASIPVILVSGDYLAPVRVASLGLTCLRKPIGLATLRELVQRFSTPSEGPIRA